ncbi:exported hypothetical protein [uncultured Paludibacter sp.]|nr:exported hypothetical protein [uncultured Paludibacter sp.]
MKKIFTLFVISFGMILTLNGQNLIDYWNGYNVSMGTYATGEGSQCKYWGWSTMPATAESNWNIANGTSSIRYMDDVSGYDAGRIMYIRWDGVVSTSGKYYFKLDTINTTQLTAGHSYTFKYSYCWNSNASAPTITATVCTAKNGTGLITPLAATGTSVTTSGSVVSFPCDATAKSMRTGSIIFQAPSNGDYYIAFGADKAALCAIRDLSLIDNGDKYAGLLELQTQTDALSLGDLSAVTSDITLPTTAGTKGVTIKWASNKPSVIDSVGHVVQPAKYNKIVTLTATLSFAFDDSTYNSTKKFTATVLGIIPTPDEVAQWDFNSDAIALDNGIIKVTDTKSGFVGTVMNDARIRTIGNSDSDQFNVLDLGNGTGYFDMGTEIGEAVYSLMDYTLCGYFRIDDAYSSLGSNGNFYWTFSNSADMDADQNGYMIGSLKDQRQSVSTNYYNIGNQATGVGSNASKGAWHHFAYVQNENTGTVYIDGAQVAQNTAMTNLPGLAIPKEGFTGTLYNWLGRSNYKNDVYLRQTLLYDFRMYAVSLSVEDINLDDLVGVGSTLGKLNNAYAQNADYVDNSLVTEKDNLSLGDLSAVTSNLTLPSNGTIDPTISIFWKSSNNNLIDANGMVTRPNYYNYVDTLTATLFKNGQSITKKFYATVVLKDGTAFQNNLLVKYDFSQVSSDTIVTDVAEKHFQGIVKNDARIHSIGLSTKYNVLELGDSIGYFDLGTEMGKLMYNLKDYTMSTYYRIDTAYHDLGKDGNFLWSFSNASDIKSSATGYLIAKMNNQSIVLTPSNYSNEQGVNYNTVALQGGWHHLAYTQSGTTGTVYVDGMPAETGEVTFLLGNTVAKAGSLGTLYNWIGRSCYSGDVYLRNTMVYDFRLYDIALTQEQIQTTELNVGNTINALDVAYSEDATAVPSVNASLYKVASSKGVINIFGLNGTEKILVHDVSGRQINHISQDKIYVNPGVYVVRINNFTTKVIVR